MNDFCVILVKTISNFQNSELTFLSSISSLLYHIWESKITRFIDWYICSDFLDIFTLITLTFLILWDFNLVIKTLIVGDHMFKIQMRYHFLTFKIKKLIDSHFISQKNEKHFSLSLAFVTYKLELPYPKQF